MIGISSHLIKNDDSKGAMIADSDIYVLPIAENRGVAKQMVITDDMYVVPTKNAGCRDAIYFVRTHKNSHSANAFNVVALALCFC